jgi:bifunctional DNA-binding transcriptional regulator/antitoxin component of YhaV-PrlF toxin-antitoxin module
VTIPKAIADRYAIAPGDELEWVEGVDSVRIVPAKTVKVSKSIEARLALFDASIARQRERERGASRTPSRERGWTREELYDRGRSR